MSYKQLTQEERYQIYALNKAGHDQATIAGILDRNPGTISRELRRNRGLKGYRRCLSTKLSCSLIMQPREPGFSLPDFPSADSARPQ